MSTSATAGWVRAARGDTLERGASVVRSSRDGRSEAEVDPVVRQLAAARNGDRDAFVAIIDQYDERLRSLAYHVVRDSEATRDVLQDAYVKAYLGLPGFREDADLGTWLYRIVYTTCLNHLRSASRRPQASGDDPAPALERLGGRGDPSGEIDATLDLAGVLRSLPAEQRAAVVLVDAWGLGFARAAEVLGVPQGTVASRVAAARDKLRPALRPAVAAAGDEKEGS
jgi:RNA polymerase sigma-70 factor, ECF subfamily